MGTDFWGSIGLTLGLATVMLASEASVASATTIIGVGVSNGGFETVIGGDNTIKDQNFTLTPNWVLRLPTSGQDSGTDDTAGGGDFGSREAFIQPAGQVYNVPTSPWTIAAGDIYNFSGWHTENGRGIAVLELLAWDGVNPYTFAPFGPVLFMMDNTDDPEEFYSGSYTVLGTEGFIGQQLTVRLTALGNYPEVDNIFLAAVPEPTSVALLGLGGLAILLLRRRA